MSDKIGDKALLVGGTFFILLGWLIICLGMIKSSYFIIMVGEMMQSLTTTILDELSSIIPARWFANDEFTFANGISESVS